MKLVSFTIILPVLLLFVLPPSIEALKCYKCGDAKEFCYDSPAEIIECPAGRNTSCIKMEVNNERAVIYDCDYPELKDGCQAGNGGTVCVNRCDTSDLCNSVAPFKPLKCVECGPCGDSLPEPTECNKFSKATQCMTSVAATDSNTIVSRACVKGSFGNGGCSGMPAGIVCTYLCSSDGCNSVGTFRPNDILIYIIGLISFIMYALPYHKNL